MLSQVYLVAQHAVVPSRPVLLGGSNFLPAPLNLVMILLGPVSNVVFLKGLIAGAEVGHPFDMGIDESSQSILRYDASCCTRYVLSTQRMDPLHRQFISFIIPLFFLGGVSLVVHMVHRALLPAGLVISVEK